MISRPNDTTEWRTIDSAPKEPFVFDVPMDNPDIPYRRLRMGPEIMVRGTHDGLTEEFRAVWTVEDDRPGFWFGDATEPIDWPLSEWRQLTPEEIKDAQS